MTFELSGCWRCKRLPAHAYSGYVWSVLGNAWRHKCIRVASISFWRSNFKLFSFRTFNQSKPPLHSCRPKYARRFPSGGSSGKQMKWYNMENRMRAWIAHASREFTCVVQKNGRNGSIWRTIGKKVLFVPKLRREPTWSFDSDTYLKFDVVQLARRKSS